MRGSLYFLVGYCCLPTVPFSLLLQMSCVVALATLFCSECTLTVHSAASKSPVANFPIGNLRNRLVCAMSRESRETRIPYAYALINHSSRAQMTDQPTAWNFANTIESKLNIYLFEPTMYKTTKVFRAEQRMKLARWLRTVVTELSSPPPPAVPPCPRSSGGYTLFPQEGTCPATSPCPVFSHPLEIRGNPCGCHDYQTRARIKLFLRLSLRTR